MRTVSVDVNPTGSEASFASLGDACAVVGLAFGSAGEGIRIVPEPAWPAVEDPKEPGPEARGLVSGVLQGGRLLLALAPEGEPTLDPVLPLFGLESDRNPIPSPVQVDPAPHPAAAGGPGTWGTALGVSGAGWAVWRAGSRAVCLAAERGAGRVLLLGCVDCLKRGDPAQLAGMLAWLAQKDPADPR